MPARLLVVGERQGLRLKRCASLLGVIDLMNKLKDEVDRINPNIPGLTEVSGFATSAQTLLQTAKNLLPNEANTIDDVLSVVNVVSSLPSLDAVKDQLKQLIDAIVADLNNLKS